MSDSFIFSDLLKTQILESMKNKSSFSDFSNKEYTKNENLIPMKEGITMRLLEKYKPTQDISEVDKFKNRKEQKRVA